MHNNITKKDDDILSMKNSIKNDDIPLWMQNSESNNRQIDSRNKIEDEQPIKPNINENSKSIAKNMEKIDKRWEKVI